MSLQLDVIYRYSYKRPRYPKDIRGGKPLPVISADLTSRLNDIITLILNEMNKIKVFDPQKMYKFKFYLWDNDLFVSYHYPIDTTDTNTVNITLGDFSSAFSTRKLIKTDGTFMLNPKVIIKEIDIEHIADRLKRIE